MKRPKLKRGDFVEIDWLDAATHEDGGWMSEEDFIESPPGMPVKTVGIYIAKTKNRNIPCYRIVGNRHSSQECTVRVVNCIDIPVGCMEGIRKLR